MAGAPPRSVKRWLASTLLCVAAPPLLYAFAALVLGVIPVNADFVPDRQGIPIYLRTNGTHVDLVVPTRTAHWDFGAEFPPQLFPRLDEALPWIAFGWGDRDFLLHTPTWADVRPMTALRAVSGFGVGAMHVEYVEEPRDFVVVKTRLAPAQYLRVVGALRAGFGRDASLRPQRIEHPGYGVTDAFFVGTGRYLPWLTSNEWVRRTLAEGGVRTAAWAPFEPALLWHARKVASD
jgi:uncharacterized protein (TIGR02117 family)